MNYVEVNTMFELSLIYENWKLTYRLTVVYGGNNSELELMYDP